MVVSLSLRSCNEKAKSPQESGSPVLHLVSPAGSTTVSRFGFELHVGNQFRNINVFGVRPARSTLSEFAITSSATPAGKRAVFQRTGTSLRQDSIYHIHQQRGEQAAVFRVKFRNKRIVCHGSPCWLSRADFKIAARGIFLHPAYSTGWRTVRLTFGIRLL